MTRKIMLASFALLVALSAHAQTPPPRPQPSNNAINSPGHNNSDTAVTGANSFTEGQAKIRIEQAGYAGVSELKKDDYGVWRAKAVEGHERFNVNVDFQGNVTKGESLGNADE